MALTGKATLLHSEASRTLLYITQKVASDSAFPFKPGDELLVRIVKDRLVIERLRV